MIDVLGGVAGLAAEHVAVDPEVAGLLLRERVEDIARTERPQERLGIGAAGVVALAATAIEREALAAVASTRARTRAAISAIATPTSIASKPPSARRRSGVVRLSLWCA